MNIIIIIFPLLGSIITGIFGRKVGIKGSQIFSSCLIIITTVLGIVESFKEVGINNNRVCIILFKWLSSEAINIIWGFQLDSLTVNLVCISFIWAPNSVLMLKGHLYQQTSLKFNLFIISKWTTSKNLIGGGRIRLFSSSVSRWAALKKNFVFLKPVK